MARNDGGWRRKFAMPKTGANGGSIARIDISSPL
jgi:hypothetical protein